MSLYGRRIIFYLLLTLFLIVAPAIIGYTAGYRWSFTQRRFLKTGAISVATIPEDASIKVNGKEYAGHTPALIRNLLPGNYNIEIFKTSYRPWQKTLPVQSEQTAFAIRIPLFKETAPQASARSAVLPASSLLPEALGQFFMYYDTKLNKIIVVNNDSRKRVAELDGKRAIWREKSEPLLFIYSSHEVWQFDPARGTRKLITRLLDDINGVLTLPKFDALLLVFKNRVRAIELDLRDRQNSWDLATFDEIKNASLAENGKTLLIQGTREGQGGVWELELY